MNSVIPNLQDLSLHTTSILLLASCLGAMADGLTLANCQVNDFAGSANRGACYTTLSDEGSNDISTDTLWRSPVMANNATDASTTNLCHKH